MTRSHSKRSSAYQQGRRPDGGFVASEAPADEWQQQQHDQWKQDQEDYYWSQIEKEQGVGVARPRTIPSEPDGTRQPPPLNIMGLQSSHDDLNAAISNVKVIAGVDKLTLLIYSDGSDGVSPVCPAGRKATFQQLLDGRAVNDSKGDYASHVDLLGFRVYPQNGYKICQRFFCPVSFRIRGCRVAIGRPEWDSKVPAAQVIIDATALTLYGHELMLDEVRSLMAALGIVVNSACVSLLHICFDLLHVRTSSLVNLLDGGCQRGRYKWSLRDVHGPAENRHGLTCGSSADCRLNLYDKMKLLRKQQDEASFKELPEVRAKYGALVARWQCEPDEVCRIEKQMSGSYLRRRFANCRDVDDVFRRLNSICKVMVTEQLEMLADVGDGENGHKSRVPVHPFWKVFVDRVSAIQWHSEPVDVEKIRREVKAKTMQRLKDDVRRTVVRNLALNPVPASNPTWLDIVEHHAALVWAAIDSVDEEFSLPKLLADGEKLRAEWDAAGVLPLLDDGPRAIGTKVGGVLRRLQLFDKRRIADVRERYDMPERPPLGADAEVQHGCK